MHAVSQLDIRPEPTGTEMQPEAYWWIFLVTGSLWTLFSLLLFRFDYTSITAVSILVGTCCLAAALGELIDVFASHGWWRAGRAALAAAFLVIGLVAFVHPGNTFNALAAIFAFYLLLRGMFTFVAALINALDPRWVGIASGAVQIGLAFWAAGDFGHKTVLLLVWVGLSALIQGVTQIVLAFQLHSLRAAP